MASQADQPSQAKNLLAASSQNAGGFDINKHIPPKLNNKGFNKEATLRDAAQANLVGKESSKIPQWWGSPDNPYNKRTDRAELFATRKAG